MNATELTPFPAEHGPRCECGRWPEEHAREGGYYGYDHGECPDHHYSPNWQGEPCYGCGQMVCAGHPDHHYSPNWA